MKKISLIVALMAMFSICNAKTAVVVVAHGAPSPKWNEPALNIEKELRKIDIPGIAYKRVALMEFAQPDICSVFSDCEKEGVDSVFVVPLFIAPSSHSDDDIPNLLGLKYDPEVRATLAEEKARFVKTDMHIILGPTLSSGDLIEKSMLERVKSLSTDPSEEAVILLAHGDPDRIGFWNELLKKTSEYVAEGTSISYTDSKLVAMGFNLSDDIRDMVQKAAKERDRIILQGIYLSSALTDMMPQGQEKFKESLGLGSDTELVVSDNGILPLSTADAVAWIAGIVKSWRSR
jgi:sirohydrochlorin ferrochelatase